MGYKKKTLVYQIKQTLDSKLAIGRSRHEDKKTGADKDRIYSWSTWHSYVKHANYFAAYCKDRYGCKNLVECRQYADEWLQSRSDLSAYTLKLEVATLSKLYGDTADDYVSVKQRNRSDISRSRGDAVRDRNFNEDRNRELVDFCLSTGLRRNELESLRGDSLVYIDDKPYIYVHAGSKGGKERYAPIINNIDLVVARMTAAGSGKVWPKVNTNADIHGYRAQYATALYNMHARPIDQIPYDKYHAGIKKNIQSDVYIPRKDQRGVRLDKKAMLIVSQALGHNRIEIFASHYLR